MFELHLKGFKTEAQVKAFMDWYEGQGEQDATIWFECRKEEGEIDVETMNVDLDKEYTWEGNALVAFINPE